MDHRYSTETVTSHELAPFCIWLTGLSGSGKSTLAQFLKGELFQRGQRSYVLDGDDLRKGLNVDLDFSDHARKENIRRTAEVSRILFDAGIVVIVALISPFEVDRALARSLFPQGKFVEVFVDAPYSVCESRDPKGLYRSARGGTIKNFTGLDSPYERPSTPDLHLRTNIQKPQECIAQLLKIIGVK